MTDFTSSIHKLEKALQTLRDLDNVQLVALPADKIAAYLAPVERLIQTWTELPGELTTVIERIQWRRDHTALLQSIDELTPTQKAELKARFFSEE